MGDNTDTAAQPHPSGNAENGTVIVEGDPVTIDGKTTAADLKEMAGKDPDMTVTYLADDDIYALNDDAIVLDKVGTGTELSFQDIDEGDPYFG
jgi:hypothetical protein